MCVVRGVGVKGEEGIREGKGGKKCESKRGGIGVILREEEKKKRA